MEYLSYILLISFFPISLGLFFKYYLRKSYTWPEFFINIAATLGLITIVFVSGNYVSTTDKEIWNGKVVGKERIHDHYVESYECFCTCVSTDKNGFCTQEVCQTCYEDHYTVDWNIYSTVGQIDVKYLDRTSKGVYNEPDPTIFKNVVVGEPASREKVYTNYVRAVPESLFNTKVDSFYPIPNYPKVYNLYKITRVLNVDSKISNDEIKKLNDLLNNSLITLGKQKQVNFIVVLTEIDDPNYRHDVENSWIGGKKNDVVVFIGLDGTKITWTDVMTWALNSGNELFNSNLKWAISELGEYNSDKISETMVYFTNKHYDRPKMKDYEYLKDDIKPPSWVLILCFISSIILSLSLTFYFHKNEVC